MWLLWTICELSAADVNVVLGIYEAPSQAAAWPKTLVLPSLVTYLTHRKPSVFYQ